MSRFKMGTMVIALALGFATVGWTQGMRGGMGRQMPRMLGAFKPVVGEGAQYQMTAKNGTMSFTYAIVGKEDVEGSTGYWMEMRMESPGMPGETVMKHLMVLGGDRPQIKRMIMQSPGSPPMEMPMGMMLGMGQRGQAPGQGDTSPGERVGSETITVPAGTFECEHYRKVEPHGTVDVWISSKVSPYGTVKMSSGEMTMVLEKVLSNETSHIKGEPQKMDMSFPRQ
ncbi:MAG: DUF4412 domain-containing protein [Terriglobia bacterium]|jgi:hypothetical protein